jgi:RNA polymerase sigma-70 factor (ECF subfamily)
MVMRWKKPPTKEGPAPYSERMELVYSQDRRREESERESDRQLALLARDGDLVAFESLVARKTPAVISVARRILGNTEDARDVAQMVFLRVWEQLGRYDEQYSFNTWLYRITTNLAIDLLRSTRSREKAHGATLFLIRARQEGSADDASRLAEDAELSRLFHRISGAMSGKQKAAFVLREMEDRDTREIAEILGCGESTVRNHLFNARRVMRRELARIYPALLGRGRKK